MMYNVVVKDGFGADLFVNTSLGKEEATMKCFAGFCPNSKTRYLLSKKAYKIFLLMDKLLQDSPGSDPISFRAPLQLIVEENKYGRDALPSRVLILDQIMDALKDPNLNMIGVYGMGGVGKTTLAKEVLGQAVEQKLFETVVMVAVSQTPELRRIQGEIADFLGLEFLAKEVSGRASQLHREQQFYLWFDPTADFHTYSILWNSQRIIFSVDGTPIREFKNMESKGVPFPKNQPMRIHSSLWNADDWATRGGLVKTDWSHAPFTASYRNFNACVESSSTCGTNSNTNSWLSEEIDSTGKERLQWVQKNYMIYNYCSDLKRFPQGLPVECNLS